MAVVPLLALGVLTGCDKGQIRGEERAAVKRADDTSAETVTSSSGPSDNPLSELGENTKVYVDPETGKMWVEYTDANGNGIPDELENLIAGTNLDGVFYVSIGTIVGLITSLITLIYSIRKTKKTNEAVTANSDKSCQAISTFSQSALDNVRATKEASKVANECSESTKALIEENKEMAKKMAELSKTNEELTKGYASLNEMCAAILVNQEAMANTEENFKNGTLRQVRENNKGALAYGKQEKDKSEAD